MSILSNLVFSKSFNEYHNLSDNLVASENYEIKKLINGEIEAVLFNKSNNTILVVAASHLWKINTEGYIIDTLSSPRGLHSSGIVVWEGMVVSPFPNYLSFSDWAFSGNKSEQKIPAVADATNMTDTEFAGYLDKADIAEFFYGYKSNKDKYGICLLRTNDRWTAMDISNRADKIERNCHKYDDSRYHDILQETCLDGYDDKHKNKMNPILSGLPYKPDWKDATQPIFMQKFSRSTYYFEEGFGSWLLGKTLGKILKAQGVHGRLPESYWYGTGYFQLNHQSELLNFKAFVANEEESINFKNFSLHDIPGGIYESTKFMTITYKGREHGYNSRTEDLVEYHEKDVGFYALRKKTRLAPKVTPATTNLSTATSITVDQASSYLTRNPWQVVFKAKKSRYSVWGNIGFFNSAQAAHHYLLDVAAVPAELHALPKKLSVNWEDNTNRPVFKLYLSNGEVAWYHQHGRRSTMALELIFDEAEILAAFQKLDSDKQSLQFEMHMEEIDKVGAALTLSLRNSKESIQLERTKFVFNEPRYEKGDKVLLQEFEKGKLIIEYEIALRDKNALQNYMDIASDIAAHSPHVKEYGNLLIGNSNDLLNIYTGIDGNKVPEKIVYHFINKIFPYIGKVGNADEVALNTEIIASNSLALAISNRNDELSSIVFEKLLGPNFNVTNLKSSTLLFNVACFYASKKAKEPMLAAIKLALDRGQKAEQFKSEVDFKDYWDDADFLKVLALTPS